MTAAAKPPTDTPPRPLSRERIVDACVAIADGEGPDAVTLRRIGRELGFDPTALYRHFRDKGELLSAAADRALAEGLEGIRVTGDWKSDLRNVARHVRSVYLRHPGLVILVANAPAPLPSEARLTEAGLAILGSSGLPATEAVVAFEVLQDYLIAVTATDAVRAGGSAEPWRQLFASLPPDEYPNLAASGRLLYRDPEARFTLGLDLLIEAIDARVAARAST